MGSPLITYFNLYIFNGKYFLLCVSLMCRASHEELPVWSFFFPKNLASLSNMFSLNCQLESSSIPQLTITLITCFPISVCGEFSEAHWLLLLLLLPLTKTTCRTSRVHMRVFLGELGVMSHISPELIIIQKLISIFVCLHHMLDSHQSISVTPVIPLESCRPKPEIQLLEHTSKRYQSPG